MHSLEVLQARNFQKITLQRIFDAGWQAFVVEGKPWAKDPKSGRCFYDDGNGNCCAVGLCIPSTHPVRTDRFMGSAGVVRFNHPELFDSRESSVPMLHQTLNQLQLSLHDDLAAQGLIPGSPEVREAYLAAAVRFRLKVPE